MVMSARRDLLHSPRRTQIGVADSKPGPTLAVVKIERLSDGSNSDCISPSW